MVSSYLKTRTSSGVSSIVLHSVLIYNLGIYIIYIGTDNNIGTLIIWTQSYLTYRMLRKLNNVHFDFII